MHSLTVLLLVAIIAPVGATDCCPYPLSSSSVHTKNVTSAKFQCSEPIQFACELHDNFIGIAIVGNGTSVALMSYGRFNVSIDITCHAGLWTLGRVEAQFLFSDFMCANQDIEGKIVISN